MKKLTQAQTKVIQQLIQAETKGRSSTSIEVISIGRRRDGASLENAVGKLANAGVLKIVDVYRSHQCSPKYKTVYNLIVTFERGPRFSEVVK